MRIGVISDTHIKENILDLPKVILDEFKKVDLILHAGDLVNLSVLDELNKLAQTKAVVGNMDFPEVVRTLPKKEVIKVGKFKIGLIHGYGPPEGLMERIRKEFDADIDMIVFGHSHRAVNETVENVLFFNPGSPTDKIFAPYNSFGIIDIASKIKARIITL
ncbi:MAG: metallophosphoesterase family protein [Candidatus Omnitrophica bacterium]|nr:metallophosphoesterase family protein [Candidatus Omnitrophota bacterium]